MKRIIIFLCVLIISDVVYSQVIFEKDELTNTGYKLYLYTATDHIVIQKKNNVNTLSYRGFLNPSKPGEIALPSFDVYIRISTYKY